ncbi:MAG: glycoside hydrolase family 97 N-terminal domain-containing protein, partial [Gammaproteobacteria bacterium]|nr:glycoside hydrolase family 97 N-terminal domain-containing protein [Gammaproteobacteria bacterium]
MTPFFRMLVLLACYCCSPWFAHAASTTNATAPANNSNSANSANQQQWQLQSPDHAIALIIRLEPEALSYQVNFQGKPVLNPSKLGLAF